MHVLWDGFRLPVYQLIYLAQPQHKPINRRG